MDSAADNDILKKYQAIAVIEDCSTQLKVMDILGVGMVEYLMSLDFDDSAIMPEHVLGPTVAPPIMQLIYALLVCGERAEIAEVYKRFPRAVLVTSYHHMMADPIDKAAAAINVSVIWATKHKCIDLITEIVRQIAELMNVPTAHMFDWLVVYSEAGRDVMNGKKI